MPRALRWSWGGGQFLVSEVPLYTLRGAPEAGEAVKSPGVQRFKVGDMHRTQLKRKGEGGHLLILLYYSRA